MTKIINITVTMVPHPHPEQALDLFARLGLEFYEKEIAAKADHCDGGET